MNDYADKIAKRVLAADAGMPGSPDEIYSTTAAGLLDLLAAAAREGYALGYGAASH